MPQLKKLTLPKLLEYISEKFENNIALADLNSAPITYLQFKEKVDSIAKFLKDQGIITGDRVAILSENKVNWGIAYFAITIIGAIGVPIMTEFQDTEVHHVLRHSESKAIFISSKQYDKIADQNFENMRTKILVDDFSIIPSDAKTDIVKQVLFEGKKEFAKIKEAALKFVGIIPDEVEENDTALILYTSGTTGHSKGVMLSHKNVISNALSVSELVDLNETDRMLSILPLFHTIESTLGLVTPLMVGASVYYLDKPPTPAILLPAFKKVKPTAMVAVPLIIEKIYKQRVLPEINKKAIVRSLYKLPYMRKKINRAAGKKLYETFGGELRMFCIGGAALAPEVEQFLNEAKFPYAIGYGLTETSPLLTGTDPQHIRLKSSGFPIADVEIRIENPDPETGEGEILARGPNVMQGYFKDPERTKQVLTDDKWFHTGDLGYMDEDNYVFIKGRIKNVIIGANGKNIYPEEVESVLNELPYVLESIVHERENQLIAKVHLNYEEIDKIYERGRMDDAEARKLIGKILDDTMIELNQRIASFSRIKKIIEQPEPFEKTATKKIKRYLYI
ncbi:MAG: AMP-binding protein [bacterium]